MTPIRWAHRIASGFLVAGIALAAALPASADGKHNRWKYDNGHRHGHQKDCEDARYYYGPPDVVYVQPRPVYVRQKIYVREPVYYEPAPVIYQRPQINIVIPLFD